MYRIERFSKLKCLFTVFFILVLMTGCQTNHILFKGIPIDGRVESFTQIMEQKGYDTIDRTDLVQIVRGKEVVISQGFRGQLWEDDPFSYNTEVVVFGTDISGIAYKVCVQTDFPSKESLYIREFQQLADLLKEKYGIPRIIKLPLKDFESVLYKSECINENQGEIIEYDSIVTLYDELDQWGFCGYKNPDFILNPPDLDVITHIIVEKTGIYVATFDDDNGTVKLILSVELDVDSSFFGLGMLYLDSSNFERYIKEAQEYEVLSRKQMIDQL